MPRGWFVVSATSAVGLEGATAGAGRGNRGGDLLEIFGREAQRSRIEPSVYLRRAAGADDGCGDSRPCQGPCERHARNAGIVSRRYRLHGVCDFQIADEGIAGEIGRARTPVVLGQRFGPFDREGSRQQPGCHGTVDDHAGVVRAAPWQLNCRHVAADGGERRLQRVDMAQPLGGFELRRIMIRKASATNRSRRLNMNGSAVTSSPLAPRSAAIAKAALMSSAVLARRSRSCCEAPRAAC